MRTYRVKPQGIRTAFLFRGPLVSVTSFCEGLALGLEVEVTFTYKSHRTRIVGGTGINTLDLDGLHYVYSRPTKLRQEK